MHGYFHGKVFGLRGSSPSFISCFTQPKTTKGAAEFRFIRDKVCKMKDTVQY